MDDAVGRVVSAIPKLNSSTDYGTLAAALHPSVCERVELREV